MVQPDQLSLKFWIFHSEVQAHLSSCVRFDVEEVVGVVVVDVHAVAYWIAISISIFQIKVDGLKFFVAIVGDDNIQAH